MQETPEQVGPEVAPETPAKSNRSALLIVFLVVFIDLLGFGIVLPLLPVFADDYLGGSARTDAASGAVLGLLMASFSLMQFLFAPVWGRISDRIGRRPVLLIGLAGSVVFYGAFGLVLMLPRDQAMLALALLFVCRIGQGVAGATISTAQAVIADCTPPERRKHGMALIGAAFGIGFTFGPLIAFGAMYWFPSRHEAVGFAASGLSLVAFLLGVRLLPETRQFGAAPPLQRRFLNFAAMKTALMSPSIGPIILTFFLATLGFAGFETTLALLLKEVMHIAEKNVPLMFAYVGFVLMLTQGFFYRRLANRLSEVAFMALGIVFMGLATLGLGVITYLATEASTSEPFFWPLLAALTGAVVGFAFLTPSAQALISRRTGADQQGEILGINQSASALAHILGPILGLTLYKSTSSHLLPYLFGGGLILLMLPLIPRIRRG